MVCWKCGKETGIYSDRDDRRFYCLDCESKTREEREECKEAYLKYKFLHIYEMALENLTGKTTGYTRHKKACEMILKTGLQYPAAFDSSDEILAAIILITSGFHVKTQVSIGRYRVDFYLEKQKTIVEIDGDKHAQRMKHDIKRDIEIRQVLGAEWEIVRIPTSLLRAEPEALISLIRRSRRELTKLRHQHRKEMSRVNG